MSRRLMLACLICFTASLESHVAWASQAEKPEPTDAARRAAEQIRRKALLPPNAGRPLPLVSHWNMGSQGRG